LVDAQGSGGGRVSEALEREIVASWDANAEPWTAAVRGGVISTRASLRELATARCARDGGQRR
jgi:hypothetical protein